MVCDAQELISANPCLSALSPRQLKVVKVGMMCNIKNFLDSGEPISCDIQTILDDSACFNALSFQMLEVLETQLLCDIANLL